MTAQRFGTAWLALILTAVLAAPPDALAQPEDDEDTKAGNGGLDDQLFDCKKARGRFKVNLKPDIELQDLVTWAFSFTCRNFVFGSGIGGRSAKVTLMTPREMTAQQAWRVFLVALQSMNLTVVPKGNVLEIVEITQAKQAPLPIYARGKPGSRDQVVRVVLRPENLGVEDLQQILNELKSKNGEVKAVPKAGIVMVTDLASNVRKMSSLMLTVDKPVVGERLYLIRLEHANAVELASKLQEILGAQEEEAQPQQTQGSARARARARRRARRGNNNNDDAKPEGPSSLGDSVQRAVPSKILPEERTNSLIVLASEAAYLRVRALARRLDVALDVEGGGRIHVYFLENADAEELANTLTTVISGIEPASQQQQQQQGQRGRAARRAQQAAQGGTGTAAFEGEVRVTHDKPTNSLVIVASVGDFLSLRQVIRKLDIRRPQVYIEATIVEISVDNSRDLGVSFHGGKEVGDGNLLLGGVQHNQLASLNLGSLVTATGLVGGALGPLLPEAEQLLGTSIPSFGILFQALATNSNVNVLSSPHITTSDNEEAEISVGENIPYQSAFTNLGGLGGQQGGAGTSFLPTQSIQRQDVALTLKITPQINASDMVRLEIDLEISDIASRDFQGLGPSWAKRTIKDTVIVSDQQSVVLGGLMSERETMNESKVPFLGDIPLLGYLFKFQGRSKEKTNLLVLLTPYIVKNQLDIEQIVERRVREQRDFARTFSSFEDMKYRPGIDYRRKRGLVEEINQRAEEVEEEREILRSLDERMEQIQEGPIEYYPDEDEEVDEEAGGEDEPEGEE